MASNVFVLLPDGRRKQVKTTPAMSLKSILDKVIEEAGLAREMEYGLRRGKEDFDLSLTVRFANLAAGAKLNLVRKEKRAGMCYAIIRREIGCC